MARARYSIFVTPFKANLKGRVPELLDSLHTQAFSASSVSNCRYNSDAITHSYLNTAIPCGFPSSRCAPGLMTTDRSVSCGQIFCTWLSFSSSTSLPPMVTFQLPCFTFTILHILLFRSPQVLQPFKFDSVGHFGPLRLQQYEYRFGVFSDESKMLGKDDHFREPA